MRPLSCALQNLIGDELEGLAYTPLSTGEIPDRVIGEVVSDGHDEQLCARGFRHRRGYIDGPIGAF
jgi:hypothetical protein